MESQKIYNPLNLPAYIWNGDQCDYDFYHITYVYSIDGVKLQQIVTPVDGPTTSTDYYGPMVLNDGELKKIRHSYGQIREIDGDFEPVFHIADHLGSPRVIFWDEDGDGVVREDEVLERIDYYPFGLEHGRPVDHPEDMESHFRYTDQEHIPKGVPYYDYVSRLYDPALGRFLGVDDMAGHATSWTPYRYGFNNPLIYIDPDGLFETRAEAKEYRMEHGIRGRIQEDSDGLFVIDDFRNNLSYFKDNSLDELKNVIGHGEDGVIKSVLVTPEESDFTAGAGMLLNGVGGFGQGMVQSGGSFRITDGASNANQLSIRYYQSGWTGGSRAQITTYSMTRVGSNIGRGSIYGGIFLGAYNINEANILDGRSFGYNTQVTTAQTAGGIAGGWGGAKGGAAMGAAIGLWFGGAGAVPGAIIGGVIGGVGGGWIGSEAARAAVNEIHYRK
jgi:RHS repeat-associated protein